MGRGRKAAGSPGEGRVPGGVHGRWRAALVITAASGAIAVVLLILGGTVHFQDWPRLPAEKDGVARGEASRGTPPYGRIGDVPLQAPRFADPQPDLGDVRGTLVSGGAPTGDSRPDPPAPAEGGPGPGDGTTAPPIVEPVAAPQGGNTVPSPATAVPPPAAEEPHRRKKRRRGCRGKGRGIAKLARRGRWPGCRSGRPRHPRPPRAERPRRSRPARPAPAARRAVHRKREPRRRGHPRPRPVPRSDSAPQRPHTRRTGPGERRAAGRGHAGHRRTRRGGKRQRPPGDRGGRRGRGRAPLSDGGRARGKRATAARPA